MKLLKVKRRVGKGNLFCDYCGEHKKLGRHAIEEEMANAIGTASCPKCAAAVLPACMLGLGFYSYYCERCGERWGTTP